MCNGWVKLHRKFLDWEWYDDANCVRVFLHFLIKANHKDKKYRGTLIKRGQLVIGRGALSEQTGLTQQQIRTVLKKLKSTSEITTESTSKGTLVTVVKYGDYQSDYKEPTSESTSTSTSNQPAINQQSTTNKNVKKERNIKINNPVDYSALGVTDFQIAEIKRIRKKNRGGAITQRVANELAKQFNLAYAQGFTAEEILTEWEFRCWKSFKFEWMASSWANKRPESLSFIDEHTDKSWRDGI